MSETILAVIGDTQIGSTTALSTPEFDIQDRLARETQTITANSMQKWLHDCWLDFWQYVREQAGIRGKSRKRRLIVVHLGDVIEGVHHGSTQLIPDIGGQTQIAYDLLMPVASMSDGFYGILGTDAHDGPAGSDAARLYEMIGARRVDYKMALSIDGVVHDFAHHGRVGRRPWTSAAASIATEVIVDYAKVGLHPPAYVWRAHNHVIDDSGEKLEGTRVICAPSWQLKTAFGWRSAAQSSRSDIGGVVWTSAGVDFRRARYKAQPDGLEVIEA